MTWRFILTSNHFKIKFQHINVLEIKLLVLSSVNKSALMVMAEKYVSRHFTLILTFNLEICGWCNKVYSCVIKQRSEMLGEYMMNILEHHRFLFRARKRVSVREMSIWLTFPNSIPSLACCQRTQEQYMRSHCTGTTVLWSMLSICPC